MLLHILIVLSMERHSTQSEKNKNQNKKSNNTSGVCALIQGLNLVPQTFNKFITIIVSVAVAFGR